MKKLPCKTIVWQKLWGKQPSVISRWWFLIVYFYQHHAKQKPSVWLGCVRFAKPHRRLLRWCQRQEPCEMRAVTHISTATLCSDLWAYWQHWHPNFGSVFWPTLVSKLGFTQVLSQLSQAAPTFADADLLLCSGTKCKPPALREFHMLSCHCLFSLILWWNWWEKKYSHWAALLLFAGISPVVPHPLFMLIQGEIVFSWSKQDLTQEDWKTQTRGKYSSDLKVSYVVGLS